MRDWKRWGKAAGIRAVKTMAQTAVATIGTTAVMSSVDWKIVFSTAALSGTVSILTSIAGLPEAEALDLEALDLKDDEYNEVENVTPETEEEGE